MVKPAKLAEALSNAIADNAYDCILLANTRYPVWSAPKTDEDAQQLYRNTQSVLERAYRLTERTFLPDTMKIDRFEVSAYRRK
ncbi:MAG: hypothetical protein F6K65_42985 [Moorea sp. SIO3C2]|nr:hypothetical protein [Moorena sp. SIO3C2]